MLVGRTAFLTLFLVASFVPGSQVSGEEGDVPEGVGPPNYRVSAFSTLHEIRVVDKEGQIVRGLKADQFKIRVAGTQRPVQYFEEFEDAAVSLAILLDIGSSASEEQILAGKRTVFELIHLLDSEDEILLAVYDQDVHFLSELTSERLILLRAVENISPGGRIGFFSKLAHAFASSGHTGWAIDRTLMQMKGAKYSNKVVLVASAAFGSIGPGTLEHLEAAGAKLFAVTWKNRVGDALNFWGDKSASKGVRRGSGGVAFPGQEIAEKIDVLRESLSCFYLVAFEPLDQGAEEKQPDLEIEIQGHPDFEVHTFRRVVRDHAFY